MGSGLLEPPLPLETQLGLSVSCSHGARVVVVIERGRGCFHKGGWRVSVQLSAALGAGLVLMLGGPAGLLPVGDGAARQAVNIVPPYPVLRSRGERPLGSEHGPEYITSTASHSEAAAIGPGN